MRPAAFLTTVICGALVLGAAPLFAGDPQGAIECSSCAARHGSLQRLQKARKASTDGSEAVDCSYVPLHTACVAATTAADALPDLGVQPIADPPKDG